jgi:hypothetical protein
MESGPVAGDEAAQADESQSRGGAVFAEPQGGVLTESGGRVPDNADVPVILDSESEWAPPTKEFSAFVGSSEGGNAGSSEDNAADGRGAREAAAALEVPPVGAAPVGARDVEVPAVEVAASEPREVEVPAVETRVVETPAAPVDAGLDAGASADEARGRVARVREGTRARVGKMRDEALVVLEEAPDDSGLRFVLTAAALFLVFLVILLLSTTVLR